MTPNQAIEMLKQLENMAKNSLPSIIFNALDEAQQEFDDRIFYRGKNAFNSPIGYYMDKNWIAERIARGFQVGYVDLKFSGDLINSIQTFPNKKGAKIEIKSGNEVIKANYQQDLQGAKAKSETPMDIFSLSKQELANLDAKLDADFNKYMDKIIDSFV